MEIDNLILVKVLQKKIDIPWGIIYDVRDIWSCLEKINYSIAQTFKENNMGANYLTNLGCRLKCRKVFHQFSDLSHSLKRILNVDRLRLLNLRCIKL